MTWTEGFRWMETVGKRPKPCRSKKRRLLKKYAQKVVLAGRIKNKKDRETISAALQTGKLGVWNNVEIVWSSHPVPEGWAGD